MSERVSEARVAGTVLGGNRHACAFFRGSDEEYEVMLPFIKEGFDQADKVFHVVDPERRHELLRQLGGIGINTEELQTSGQLEVRTWEQAHLQGRRFNQYTWLAELEEVLANDQKQGYQQTRVWSNQEWALEEVQGAEDIVEYESRFNLIAEKYPNPVICVFDLTKFDAALMVDILRTHPMVVIAGQLHENPFYVPPEQFLDELRARRQTATA